MTVYSANANIPTPELSDVPNIPLDLLTLIGIVDGQVLPTFVSAASRDATISSPVDGSKCYRSDIHCIQTYNGNLGAWIVTGSVPIAKSTLGSAVASVAFTSIPQDFTNLRLLIRSRNTTAGTSFSNFLVTYNGVTSAGWYTQRIEQASVSTVTGQLQTGQVGMLLGDSPNAGTGSDAASLCVIDIPFYSAAGITKAVHAESVVDVAAGPVRRTSVGTYAYGSTDHALTAAAVTRIDITAAAGTFAIGSIFELLGSS